MEEILDLEVDNTVDSPEMAQPQDDMTPEEAKASLGLSSRLSEQFLMSMAPQQEEEVPAEAPPEAQNAPESEAEPEVEEVVEEPAEDPEKRMTDMETDIALLKKAVINDDAGERVPS